MGFSRRLCLASGLLTVWLGAAVAFGQAGELDAAGLYDAALKQAEAGDHARAAELFLLADEKAPNPIVLVSALRAALAADDPVSGMRAVTRAEGRETTEDLTKAVTAARAAFADRAGRLTVRCAAAGTTAPGCSAKLDDGEARLEQATWVRVGRHRIVFERPGLPPAVLEVDVEPASSVEVLPPAPPPKQPDPPAPTRRPPPPPPDTEGVSPAWFGVTLGLTGALAAGTIASAVDTRDRHDEFEATGVGADDGRASELRTNVLFGVTMGGLVASAVLGFVTFLPADSSPEQTGAWQLDVGPSALRVVRTF